MRIYEWPLSSEQEKELMDCDLVTFDLFDTLVCRKYSPTESFRVYGTFGACTRKYIELAWRLLQKLKLVRDFRLDALRPIFGDKIQEEFEADLNQLIERPQVFEVFNSLVMSKKHIEIVTNTYYSNEQIRIICKKFNIPDEVNLILSSDYGLSKKQGLFSKTKTKYNISHWHFGDNVKEDSSVSKDVFVYTKKRWGSLPKFQSNECQTAKLISPSREIQRVFNEIVANYEREVDPWFWFGVFYSGPLAVGVAQKILKIAKLGNASTIYFLARDGYLPFKLLKDIKDLRTRYVPYSRLISSSATELARLSSWIEHDSKNGKSLVFDLGWRGASAKALIDEINSPVSLVLFGRWPWWRKTEDTNLFFGSLGSLFKALNVRRCPELFELALSAPHQSIKDLPLDLDNWSENIDLANAGMKFQISRGASVFGQTWKARSNTELTISEAVIPLSRLITNPGLDFLSLASNVNHEYRGERVPLVAKDKGDITYWTKGSWRYQKSLKRSKRVRMANLVNEYRRRLGLSQ
jgi:hypothetical protein